MIGDVEARECRKEAKIRLGEPVAGQPLGPAKLILDAVQSVEDLTDSRVVCLLRPGEARAINAVVELRVDQIVPPIDLRTEILRIKVRSRAEEAQHSDDVGGFVRDDPFCFAVPENRYREATRIDGALTSVDFVHGTHAEFRVGVGAGPIVYPTLVGSARPGEGNRNDIFEAKDDPGEQGAMRPWAVPRDIEVIATWIRPVLATSGDPIADFRLRTTEFPTRDRFLSGLVHMVDAVDHHAHAEKLWQARRTGHAQRHVRQRSDARGNAGREIIRSRCAVTRSSVTGSLAFVAEWAQCAGSMSGMVIISPIRKGWSLGGSPSRACALSKSAGLIGPRTGGNMVERRIQRTRRARLLLVPITAYIIGSQA